MDRRAGDGSTYRGQRVLHRDIDLPLFVQAGTRADLRSIVSRVARMLAGEMVLRFVEDDGTSWYLAVRRVSGGTFALGPDTQATDWLTTVVTLRAGDPYWTSSVVSRQVVSAAAGRGLLADPDGVGPARASLVFLRVSSSQTLGDFTMENTGDAPARPVWTIDGPGEALVIASASGESLAWNGTLGAGETLTIDTNTAAVTDQTGASRYAELGPAPRLWRIPPGITTAHVELGNTDPASSRIVAEWRARRWTVL